MTTFRIGTFTCSVCGHSSQHMDNTSSIELGHPDLDLRPSELARSTMSHWLQTCPACGYVAPNLSDPTKATRAWLASDTFRSLDGIDPERLPFLAETFYRRHKICLVDGDPVRAAHNLLHAAWACDDEELADLARELRLRCVRLIDENPSPTWDEDDARMVRVDILRRAGLFDRAVEECRHAPFEGEVLAQVADFEVELARAHDDGRYTVGDAIGEPEEIDPRYVEDDDPDEDLLA